MSISINITCNDCGDDFNEHQTTYCGDCYHVLLGTIKDLEEEQNKLEERVEKREKKIDTLQKQIYKLIEVEEE